MARRALVCGSCFAAGEPIPRELLKMSVGFEGDTKAKAAGDQAADWYESVGRAKRGRQKCAA